MPPPLAPPAHRAGVGLAIALGAASLSAQNAIVARYVLDGHEAAVSADDLALELGQRFARTERGEGARKFLIDLQLIRTAADRAKLHPTPSDTQAWIRALEKRLAAANMNLAALTRSKGMSRDDFQEFAALQLAHERLVRRALDLGPDDEVKPEMLRLWIEEAQRKTGVVTDPGALPSGIVARVGDQSLTQLDLGRVLGRTMDIESRRKYTRQIVLKSCLRAAARAHDIQISAAEMTAEVEARRQQAASNPAYQGLAFEELLKTQGSSIEALRASPVLRAQIQERKLVLSMLSDEEIERQLRDDTDRVVRQHGARRRLRLIVIGIRADRDAAATRALAEQVRERIEGGLPFDEAARSYSEDTYSKVSGGDAGWHHRSGSSLPDAVIEAAFATTSQETSLPIVTPDAVYLLRVDGREPPTNDATLRFRMRKAFADDLRQRMLDDARIRFEPGS